MFYYENGKFLLGGTNGKKSEYSGIVPRGSLSNLINFYRKGDNFGYVHGGIDFSDNCKNNVIISDLNETRVSNTQNSFISINKRKLLITPINEIQENLEIAINLLKNKKIIYNTPKKVLKRENLRKKEKQ